MTKGMAKALTGAMLDRWARIPTDTHPSVRDALLRRGLAERTAGYNVTLTGVGAIAALDLTEGI